MYRPFSFNSIPTVVKNLLIINILVFILMIILRGKGDVQNYLVVHYFQSSDFKPYQLVTHMFLHANIGHLLGNMLGLWVFGSMLEEVWGPKRFLIFYFVTGIGASLCDQVYLWFRLHEHISYYQNIYETSNDPLLSEQAFNMMKRFKDAYSSLGASGAVYGVMLGAAMLFPNREVMLYFAIPVKLKYLALILLVGQLIATMNAMPGDNVNHFVHLAGMAFAFVMIQIWKRDRNNFY